MGKFNRGNEQQFYLRNTTGATGQTPWGQLQRTYYAQYLADATINATKVSLQDLQIRWMKKWITTNGGTPPNSKFESVLWKTMVSTLGKPVSNITGQNIFTFFANANN